MNDIRKYELAFWRLRFVGGAISAENPAVQFTRDAKSGKYDAYSDEYYRSLLEEVKLVNDEMFQDNDTFRIATMFVLDFMRNLVSKPADQSAEDLFDEMFATYEVSVREFLMQYVGLKPRNDGPAQMEPNPYNFHPQMDGEAEDPFVQMALQDDDVAAAAAPVESA